MVYIWLAHNNKVFQNKNTLVNEVRVPLFWTSKAQRGCSSFKWWPWDFEMVLWRGDDRCVGAATRVCHGSTDVDMAEAMGLREALRWLVEIKSPQQYHRLARCGIKTSLESIWIDLHHSSLPFRWRFFQYSNKHYFSDNHN
jgi:hypothetical protein